MSMPIAGSALHPKTVTQWLEAAGLDGVRQQTLPPGPHGKIAVSLWLARDPRMMLAAPTRESRARRVA